MEPLASVPLPDMVVVLIGKVMVWSVPAFATGDWLAVAFTVTTSESFAMAPLLSVTVN